MAELNFTLLLEDGACSENVGSQVEIKLSALLVGGLTNSQSIGLSGKLERRKWLELEDRVAASLIADLEPACLPRQ